MATRQKAFKIASRSEAGRQPVEEVVLLTAERIALRKMDVDREGRSAAGGGCFAGQAGGVGVDSSRPPRRVAVFFRKPLKQEILCGRNFEGSS